MRISKSINLTWRLAFLGLIIVVAACSSDESRQEELSYFQSARDIVQRMDDELSLIEGVGILSCERGDFDRCIDSLEIMKGRILTIQSEFDALDPPERAAAWQKDYVANLDELIVVGDMTIKAIVDFDTATLLSTLSQRAIIDLEDFRLRLVFNDLIRELEG